MLSFARLLQGVGGGGLMTLSQALIAEAVPPRQRGRYQGYLSGMYAAAATFGPVVGGWLTQHYGWPSVFLVNLPLGVLAIVLVARLPAHPRARRAAAVRRLGHRAVRRRDRARPCSPWSGPSASTAARCRWSPCWSSLAAVALVMLLRQERRAPAPLLPVQMFRKPGIWRTDLLAACVAAQTVSMVTFLPMYLQVVRGESAAGLRPPAAAADAGRRAGLAVRRPHHRAHRAHRDHAVDRPRDQRCDAGQRRAVRPSTGKRRADRGAGTDLADHRPDHAGGADDGAGGGGTAIPRRGGGLGAVLAFGRRGIRHGAGRSRDCSPRWRRTIPRPRRRSPRWWNRAARAGRAAASMRRALVQSEIADAFRAAFLTISVFTAQRVAAGLVGCRSRRI